MRILDKHYDFYDVYQDYTDNRVFDRRGSFLLTKNEICTKLYDKKEYWGKVRDNHLILIQCGGTFWLELLTVTARDSTFPTDFKVELIDHWRNYNKPNKLLVIEEIDRYNGRPLEDFGHEFDYNVIIKNTKIIKKDIDTCNYKGHILSENKVWVNNEYIKLNKPILKSSGLISVLDPFEFFIAIEEYFSIEKTKAETTEPKGATNDDKIIMHGFDTKISFRGK